MKKLFLFIGLLLLVILFSPASFAKVNFKDMPEDHWAARSVYNIVRLGVTRGYPDGTFRGEQTINRYELMVFLSNLAIAMEKMMDEKIAQAKFNTNSIDSSTTSNKILAELKAEIDTLRASVLANQQVQADRSMAANTYSAYGSGTSSTQKNWQVHGDYTFRANTFRVSGNADPLDYISQRAHLAVGYYAPLSGIIFDLDSGYVNPAVEGIAANITKNMLAVEAWAQTPGIWDSKFRVDATSGPGDFELNDFPSNWVVTRSGTIAYRPGNALKFTWELFNFDLSGRYEKRLNNVDRSTAKLGYNLSLEEVDLGNLYFAVGSEMYSQKG
ncbi:MAG: S-layer homology domain-containing protein, partial [Candidatus Margulisbacteria bacterium]|nr:S-layer homology domain-containing protein [Candidatus Margulisiibacteriota bacterium]